LVKSTDGTIEPESSFNNALSIEGENKVIVECKEGVCKQTEGYLPNNNKIYGFEDDNEGQDVTNNSNIKKLIDSVLNKNGNSGTGSPSGTGSQNGNDLERNKVIIINSSGIQEGWEDLSWNVNNKKLDSNGYWAWKWY